MDQVNNCLVRLRLIHLFLYNGSTNDTGDGGKGKVFLLLYWIWSS